MTLAEVEQHQRKHGFVTVATQTSLPMMIASPDRIDFFMELTPPETTSQQKGVRIITPKGGKPFVSHYTKKEVEEAGKLLDAHLIHFVPANPFEGPIRLVAEWTWPWRASETKTNRAPGWRWKDTKPDAGNAQKLLEDRMQALNFFANDAQIADQRVSKQWGSRPGIRITIEALQNP